MGNAVDVTIQDDATDPTAQAVVSDETTLITEGPGQDVEDEDEDEDLDEDDDEEDEDEDDEDEDEDENEDETDESKSDDSADKKVDEGPSQEALLADFKQVAVEVHQGNSPDGKFANGDGRDTLGNVADGLLSYVKAAYNPLKPRGRATAKEFVQGKMTESMTGKPAEGIPANFQDAKAWLDIYNALKAPAPSSTKTSKPRVVVDPTEEFVLSAAALVLAANFIQVGEGIADDWRIRVNELVGAQADDVKAYAAWLVAKDATKEGDEVADEPEVHDVVKLAAKIARGKTFKPVTRRATSAGDKPRKERTVSATGERNDIGAHIIEVMADKPAGGFMSITEICATASSHYPSAQPSSGAVSNRIFKSKKPLDGLAATEDPKRGVVKL